MSREEEGGGEVNEEKGTSNEQKTSTLILVGKVKEVTGGSRK